MLGYLSADIICSEKRTVFQEQSSRKTVSYEEQIMSKDKYPSIFLPQMVTIVFIILQIFFATRAVLKIGEYSRIFPSFSWGIFSHVTLLCQSRVSKKIWWIIIKIKTESATRWSNKWTKTLYQDYLHCIANFCRALLIIFSKQFISSKTKRRKRMWNFVWNT